MYQPDLWRQHLVQPEPDNGVCLAAADFHQIPGTCDETVDRVGAAQGRVRITVLVEVLHGRSSGVPSARALPLVEAPASKGSLMSDNSPICSI